MNRNAEVVITKLIPEISSEQKIKEYIEKLKPDNCIEIYCKYKESYSEDKFERKFISKLQERTQNFAKKVLNKFFESASREKLLEEVLDCYIEGPYSLLASIDNGEESSFYKSMFNDIDLYILIYGELIAAYNELIESIELTKKEEEIKRLENYINVAKSNIEKNNKNIKEYLAKLEKIKEGELS